MSTAQGLSQKERLSLEKEMASLRRSGQKKVVTPFLVFSKKNNCGFARIAVALSKKCGKAVTRNAAKRQVREFFRKNKALFDSFDFFFYSNRSLESYSKKDWKYFHERLRNYCEKRNFE